MKQIIALLFIMTAVCAESEYSPEQIRKSIVPFMTLLAADEESLIKDKDKIDLGRILYYDKRLSPDSTINCQSCHDLKKHGSGGDYYQSIRQDGKLFRDVPSLYNLKNLKLFGWAGSEITLHNKIIDSITNTHEMNFPDTDKLLARFKQVPEYDRLFKKAFPDNDEPITLANTASALESFIKGLLSLAPIDRFLAGDNSALSDKQLQGASHFVDNNCFACHTGANFGGQMMMKVGIIKPWPNQNDQGYYSHNNNPLYKMHFRVSPLRNVELTAPYFHDASSRNILDAIRKMGYYELGKFIADDEIIHIVEFLKSLTGEIPDAYITEPVVP